MVPPPLKVTWERHAQDEEYVTWAISRVPKSTVNVRPEEVQRLPLSDVRLVLFPGAQLMQVDTCPDDWFSMHLEDLKKLAVRL